MRFLIIGGDAAGMSAASKAKRRAPDLDVVVLEQGMDVSYSACGMPYNIADSETGIDALVVRDADTFIHKNHIDLKLGHCAESIDPGAKIVRGMGPDDRPFTLAYDKLLIATGAGPVMPDIPGFDLQGVFPLKSLDHGRRIKHFIGVKNVQKAVIIGMGYVGLEMCEALRARGIEVAMVKPRPRLLPWMNPELVQAVSLELTKNRVAMHPGHAIDAITSHNGALRIECDTMALDADMVIVASGVRPNSRLARDAGLETGISDSISVDDQLRTSDPDIYSAGDCADAIHVVTGQRCWIPLALRANRAGWAVADNVCGVETRLDGVVGTAVFKLFALEIARTGLSPKEAVAAGFDPVEVVVKNNSKAHAQRGATTIYTAMTGDRNTGRLLGVQMVGEQGVAHRINAPAVALHNRMDVQGFFQTDFAYAPPFGPVWDPLLTAANQLLKKL
ncbi:NADH/FAD-dependent oxidoreductase [Desulforapulum autotrophicum HRM2]|uniref:NADH/FAD-dependent oxidoreductase n=1 Tax=Desulforapulum autotrophicum (strain ATCC 43914 / DSM 3382 / VKM B-1955 / HRM2) TaxID=177437 RepID=C0QD40_DESAH|nr:FAD-dependent oxidoreductase [Desulforapulum autotrophicum]ACN17272.1 NADH/FAD-dependent oxidoreductase [Desulforapulum autotrophicum HRM2]